MSDAQSDALDRSEFPYWSYKKEEALVDYLEDPSATKRDLVLEYARKMDQHSRRESRFYDSIKDQLQKLDEKNAHSWLSLLWSTTGVWYSRILAVSPYKGQLLIHVQLQPGNPVQIWGTGLEELVLSLLTQAELQRAELWENHMLILPQIELNKDQFSLVKLSGHS